VVIGGAWDVGESLATQGAEISVLNLYLLPGKGCGPLPSDAKHRNLASPRQPPKPRLFLEVPSGVL
jgi:hypothetical protein